MSSGIIFQTIKNILRDNLIILYYFHLIISGSYLILNTHLISVNLEYTTSLRRLTFPLHRRKFFLLFYKFLCFKKSQLVLTLYFEIKSHYSQRKKNNCLLFLYSHESTLSITDPWKTFSVYTVPWRDLMVNTL